MPIAAGQRGRSNVLGMPGRRFLDVGVFRSVPFSTKNETITGVTRDSTGTPLANCSIDLFVTPNDTRVASTVSDASGNYQFDNPGSGPFYLVAYKAGAPDVAGTTLNTVTAV